MKRFLHNSFPTSNQLLCLWYSTFLTMVDFAEIAQYVGLLAILYCSEFRGHLDESTVFGMYNAKLMDLQCRKAIHLTCFFYGMLSCIYLYLAVYLPYYKKVEEDWDDYCPVRNLIQLSPIECSLSDDSCNGSVYFIVGVLVGCDCSLTLTLWKVWGFLTIAILALAFSCIVNCISHFSYVCSLKQLKGTLQHLM